MAYERELAKLTEPQRAGLFTFRGIARSKEIEARRDDATARMTDLKHFRAFLARLEVEGMSVDEFKQAAGWMVRPESRYSGSNYFPRSCQWLTATWDDGTPKGIQLVLDYRKAKVQKEAASTGQPLREAGVVRRVEKDMKAYE